MVHARALTVLLAAVLACSPLEAEAASTAAPVRTYGNKTVTDAGDILRFALPAAAGGISLWKHDYPGLIQLVVAYGGAVGMAVGMKQFIRERRPDGSDWKSMPSDSATSAEAASAYLWHRYGWQYGLPAEAVSLFVGYSRVQAKEHHWYDVAAGDALAWGINMLIVSRQRSDRYRLSFGATPDSVGVHFAMNLE